MKKFCLILKWSFIVFTGLLILCVSAYFIFRPPSPFKSALNNSDRLELYLLQSYTDSVQKLDEDMSFPIRAYRDVRTPILRHLSLTGEKFDKIRREFLLATTPGFMQAMCHYPIYGFRFYQGEKLVVETSICFECNNFYAPKDHGYYWESLGAYNSLREQLSDILPLPPENKRS